MRDVNRVLIDKFAVSIAVVFARWARVTRATFVNVSNVVADTVGVTQIYATILVDFGLSARGNHVTS